MNETALANRIIGDSPPVRALRALILRVAPLDLPVLIEGPTGAGKELVAEALHVASGRAGASVAFNVCAVAESMFESALFGHVRGAFTGATRDSRGYLEEADGGTIFFDEIGGLALPLQAKLLRVIETREFRPVGARADRKSDFRLIAATNEPLSVLTADGRLRTDLAHRLAGINIVVPPLRDRLDDIPALVKHFVERSTVAPAAKFTAGAIQVLQQYHWPGNVRELRHAVERAIALSSRRILGREEVLSVLSRGGRIRHRGDPNVFARRRLVDVLEECGWDTVRVAQRLGVHRATVYRRMRRLGVTAPAKSSMKSNGKAQLEVRDTEVRQSRGRT